MDPAIPHRYSCSVRLGKTLHGDAVRINGQRLAKRTGSLWGVGRLNAAKLAYLYVVHNGKCQSCSGLLSTSVEIDHKIPQHITNVHNDTRHMTWDLNNLTIMCKSCNSTKGERIGEGHISTYRSIDGSMTAAHRPGDKRAQRLIKREGLLLIKNGAIIQRILLRDAEGAEDNGDEDDDDDGDEEEDVDEDDDDDGDEEEDEDGLEAFRQMKVRELRNYMNQFDDFTPTVQQMSSTGKTHKNYKTTTAMLEELGRRLGLAGEEGEEESDEGEEEEEKEDVDEDDDGDEEDEDGLAAFRQMKVRELRNYMNQFDDFTPTVQQMSSTGNTHQNYKTKTAMLEELGRRLAAGEEPKKKKNRRR
jgi:hypothetical protein